jgi:hypothetical protein
MDDIFLHLCCIAEDHWMLENNRSPLLEYYSDEGDARAAATELAGSYARATLLIQSAPGNFETYYIENRKPTRVRTPATLRLFPTTPVHGQRVLTSA